MLPHRAPYAVSTPASASNEPTDRSMPPLRMTNVIPVAISSRYELSNAMLPKFCALAKLSPKTSVPPMSTSASTMGAPARSGRHRRPRVVRCRRAGAATTSGVVVMPCSVHVGHTRLRR
jgi:hypothetical protein